MNAAGSKAAIHRIGESEMTAAAMSRRGIAWSKAVVAV
jgi:hypothetical protein